MTRSELHEIAVRRRGDPDVLALLLEIRRLHAVLVDAHELAGALSSQDGLNRDYADQRLVELLGEEPAITEQYRAAKRRAREKRA